MKISTLLLASLLLIATINSCACQRYQAINLAVGTYGGDRFGNEIGLDYSLLVLQNASSYFWDIFSQKTLEERKSMMLITLTIKQMSGIVTNINSNVNSQILLNSEYIGRFPGDVKTEFTGIMYHEIARVRQWNGNGRAPVGLITGIADFFRLKGGSYASSLWRKPGVGFQWDEGYEVTAHFLDYCNSKYPGLVVNLNAMMKTAYDDSFFLLYTNKTVYELWIDYKASYGLRG